MSSLRSFIATRIALFIPLFWFLLSIVFLLLRVLPGANPVRAMNPQMPEDQVQAISERLGLNEPLGVQYWNFLKDAISFDFGVSYYSGSNVMGEIMLNFGPTVMLAFFGVLIGVPLGIYMGGIAGANRENPKDHIIRIFTIGIYSTPIFLVGIILQILFGFIIPIFPPLGVISPGLTDDFTHYTEIWLIDAILSGKIAIAIDILFHLFLPSLALGMLIASSIARQIRTQMIYELEQDYVQFSRGRGISERKIVYGYSLKNAVMPVIGLIGLQFALLLAGAILTETVFNIPGLGRYLYQAILNKDFPAIQGVMVIFVFIVSFVSLLSDVLYAVLDPRINF